MAKISRNAPCLCGSGKKYKKCCLIQEESEALEKRKIMKQNIRNVYAEEDDLNNLSNSVIGFINSEKIDEAEAVCHLLMQRYPDQVDGIDRLATVYEARGDNEKAIEYYLKTAEFKRTNPGFDEESIEWTLEKVKQLKDKIQSNYNFFNHRYFIISYSYICKDGKSTASYELRWKSVEAIQFQSLISTIYPHIGFLYQYWEKV